MVARLAEPRAARDPGFDAGARSAVGVLCAKGDVATKSVVNMYIYPNSGLALGGFAKQVRAIRALGCAANPGTVLA